MVFDGLGRQ